MKQNQFKQRYQDTTPIFKISTCILEVDGVVVCSDHFLSIYVVLKVAMVVGSPITVVSEGASKSNTLVKNMAIFNEV